MSKQPTVKTRKIVEYQPDPQNPNAHTERGVQVLGDSLSTVGLGRSIVVDRNGIVLAGNSTQERAVDQGFEDAIEIESDGTQLIVVKRTDLDLSNDVDNRARKLSYYDNRAAELGIQWDIEQLQASLNDGVDLSHLFTAGELDELLAGLQTGEPLPDPGAQIDRAEELQQKWQVQRGQLWEIGSHRLLCGDSTNAEDVARVMAGEQADAVVTDPPYGMNLDTDYAVTAAVKGRKYSAVIGDDVKFNPQPIFDLNANEYILFGADYYCQDLPTGGSWFVWDKKMESLDASIGSGFELIWCYPPRKREMLRYLWSGFTAKEQDEARTHPTQKPIALMANLIDRTFGSVYDPFLGSGTTMVAAQQLGRICHGLEIDPRYCAVILERMSGLGLTPILVEEPPSENVSLDVTGTAKRD